MSLLDKLKIGAGADQQPDVSKIEVKHNGLISNRLFGGDDNELKYATDLFEQYGMCHRNPNLCLLRSDSTNGLIAFGFVDGRILVVSEEHHTKIIKGVGQVKTLGYTNFVWCLPPSKELLEGGTNNDSSLDRLYFLPNQDIPRLLSVHQRDLLILWKLYGEPEQSPDSHGFSYNLVQGWMCVGQEIRKTKLFPNDEWNDISITAIESDPQVPDWVYVGLSRGQVLFVRIPKEVILGKGGSMHLSTILDLDSGVIQSDSAVSVVAIQTHSVYRGALLVGYSIGTIVLYDLESLKPLVILNSAIEEPAALVHLDWKSHPSGKYVIGALQTNKVLVWSLEDAAKSGSEQQTPPIWRHSPSPTTRQNIVQRANSKEMESVSEVVQLTASIYAQEVFWMGSPKGSEYCCIVGAGGYAHSGLWIMLVNLDQVGDTNPKRKFGIMKKTKMEMYTPMIRMFFQHWISPLGEIQPQSEKTEPLPMVDFCLVGCSEERYLDLSRIAENQLGLFAVDRELGVYYLKPRDMVGLVAAFDLSEMDQLERVEPCQDYIGGAQGFGLPLFFNVNRKGRNYPLCMDRIQFGDSDSGPDKNTIDNFVGDVTACNRARRDVDFPGLCNPESSSKPAQPTKKNSLKEEIKVLDTLGRQPMPFLFMNSTDLDEETRCNVLCLFGLKGLELVMVVGTVGRYKPVCRIDALAALERLLNFGIVEPPRLANAEIQRVKLCVFRRKIFVQFDNQVIFVYVFEWKQSDREEMNTKKESGWTIIKCRENSLPGFHLGWIFVPDNIDQQKSLVYDSLLDQLICGQFVFDFEQESVEDAHDCPVAILKRYRLSFSSELVTLHAFLDSKIRIRGAKTDLTLNGLGGQILELEMMDVDGKIPGAKPSVQEGSLRMPSPADSETMLLSNPASEPMESSDIYYLVVVSEYGIRIFKVSHDSVDPCREQKTGRIREARIVFYLDKVVLFVVGDSHLTIYSLFALDQLAYIKLENLSIHQHLDHNWHLDARGNWITYQKGVYRLFQSRMGLYELMPPCPSMFRRRLPLGKCLPKPQPAESPKMDKAIEFWIRSGDDSKQTKRWKVSSASNLTKLLESSDRGAYHQSRDLDQATDQLDQLEIDMERTMSKSKQLYDRIKTLNSKNSERKSWFKW